MVGMIQRGQFGGQGHLLLLLRERMEWLTAEEWRLEMVNL